MTILCLNIKRLDMPESSNGQTGRYPCLAQGQLFCGSDGYNLAPEFWVAFLVVPCVAAGVSSLKLQETVRGLCLFSGIQLPFGCRTSFPVRKPDRPREARTGEGALTILSQGLS